MTNYEFIKNLTLAEMIDYFEQIGTCKFCSKGYGIDNQKCDGDCRAGIIEWLGKEN